KALMEAAVPMLIRLQGSGVKILLMTSKDMGEKGLEKIAEVAEVRVRDHMFGGGVILDGKEALLVLGEKKPTLVIWSDHVGLVKFAKDYFQYLWSSSKAYV
ncbi:MAG: hypothetical protein OEY83_05760, partial [Candidatus Bathyarchaeota archaeon]|nr:hypothetical protein [Candidatus Bathyarchaeota archaeon]